LIPGSRRNLFKDQSFGDRDNAYTKADKWPAEGTLHAKEEVGRGGGAHWEWCSGGGTGRWGTVVGVCLVPEGGVKKRDGGELSITATYLKTPDCGTPPPANAQRWV